MNDDQCAEITFLALCLWREARSESDEAIAGVACCVLNRVERPAWWGNDIISVLFKRWQISSLTDPKDKQLTKWPAKGDKAWARCMDIARKAVLGKLVNPVPGADSYIDISIPDPYWTRNARYVRQIGRLRFFDVDKEPERTV